MKSLETVQKTFRVFQILTKVAMILFFVWAGLAALGLLCGVVWSSGGTVVGADREVLYSLTETNGLSQLIAVLLGETVMALTDGALLAFAYHYFKAEQAAEPSCLTWWSGWRSTGSAAALLCKHTGETRSAFRRRQTGS